MTPGYFSIPHSTPRARREHCVVVKLTLAHSHSRTNSNNNTHTDVLFIYTHVKLLTPRVERECARDSERKIYKNGYEGECMRERTTKWWKKSTNKKKVLQINSFIMMIWNKKVLQLLLLRERGRGSVFGRLMYENGWQVHMLPQKPSEMYAEYSIFSHLLRSISIDLVYQEMYTTQKK